MKELDEHIRRISEKVQQLARALQAVQKENERLKQELFLLVSREKEKDAFIELLTLRVEVLKAATGDMETDDKKAFEKKLTRYLKDIDKCIGLLNE